MADEQFALELEEAPPDEPEERKRQKPSPVTSPVLSPSLASAGHQRGHFRSRSISHDGSSFINSSSPPFASSPGSGHAGLMDIKHHRPNAMGGSPALVSPRPMITLPPPSSSQHAEIDTPAPWVQPPRAVSPPLFPFSMPPVSPTLRAMSPLDEGGSSPALRKSVDLPDIHMLPSTAAAGSPSHGRKRSIGTSAYFAAGSPASPSPPRINGFHPAPSSSAVAGPSSSPASPNVIGAPNQGVIALRRRGSIDSGSQPPRARARTASPSRARSISPKRSGSQGSSTSSQGSDSDSPNAGRPHKSPRVSPSSVLRHSFSDEGLSHIPGSLAPAKRSPSYEDVINESPPSPIALLPVRSRSAHLAMPPPSGWDMSDDVDESGSDDASGSAGGSDRDEMEEDLEVGEPGGDEEWSAQKRFRTTSGEARRQTHRRSESSSSDDDLGGSPDLSAAIQAAAEDDDDEHEPWGPLVEASGSRVLPIWSGPGRPDEQPTTEGNNEQLTMLEHIFVFSKSEWREHRVIVSRSLADWMEDLDICETLEFVYPLLTALASDDDEVKLGLASALDRIMWYFYSRCPIAELSPETQTTTEMDVDASTVNRPRLSSTAFVPLLGLLLMETHHEVTAATRLAVVRFLCRLNDQPVPLDHPEPESEEAAELNAAANMVKSPIHAHETYEFDREAKLFLEGQLLSDVVLGLAHLEQEEDEQGSPHTPTPMEGIHINGDRTPPSEKTDVEAEWQEGYTPHKKASPLGNPESSPDWGEPLHRVSGSTMIERDEGNTSRDSDEITAGKIAALELSGAIAAHPLCLSGNNLESQVLSETVRLSSDGHTGVRTASAAALGHLAGALPEQIVISQVLPPFEALAADDDLEVRRATCYAVSYFVQALSPDVRRARILWAVKRFANDQQRAVKIALAQLSGQLFYALHLASCSIPAELVDFYLGRPLPSTTSPLPPTPADEKPFTPLATALSSPPALVLPSALGEQSDFLSRIAKEPPDAERSLIIAFNMPAAAQALGAPRWSELRALHLELARHPDAEVRKSIAASLHEIAKIIGPKAAAEDVAPLFEEFAMEANEVVKAAALSSATALVAALPVTAGRRLLACYIHAMFPPVTGEGAQDQSESKAAAAAKWREREQAAQALHVLAPQYAQDEPSESPFYDVLSRLVRDPAASVRLAAIDAIPDIYITLKEQLEARRRLVEWLVSTLARDTPCRSRCLFVSIVRAIAANQGADAALVSLDLLPTLVHLAEDGVIDVRIAVAREAAVLRQTLFKDDPPSLLNDAIYKLAKDESLTVRSFVETLPTRAGASLTARRSPSAELDDEMLDALNDDELMSASALRDLDDGLAAMSSSPPNGRLSSATGLDEDFVRL